MPVNEAPIPCPGWRGLIEKENSGVVVAVQKVKVFDVGDLLRQTLQADRIAGQDILLFSARDRETNR